MGAIILFIFSALVCFSEVELRPEPALYAIDGIEGLLYEIPEYEDPEVAMLQMSAMGGMPVLTVLQMAADEDHASEKEDTKSYKKLSDTITDLDDIISHLRMARSKLEKGYIQIFSDIDNSVQNLKKVERNLYSEIHFVGLPIPLPASLKSDEESTDSSEDENALSTTTQAPTSTRISDIPKVRHEDVIETQLGDSIVITEKAKVEDGGKATLRKKWTWKSSSLV